MCGRCALRFRLGPPSCLRRALAPQPQIHRVHGLRPAPHPQRPPHPGPLAKTTPTAAHTALLDQLPLAGDVLPRLTPRLKAKLFAAFDLSILWNKPGSQVTVRAEISDATLQAITAILDASQDGYHDTHPSQPDPMGDLAHTPRAVTMPHS